jgi:hypothetical protein
MQCEPSNQEILGTGVFTPTTGTGKKKKIKKKLRRQ